MEKGIEKLNIEKEGEEKELEQIRKKIGKRIQEEKEFQRKNEPFIEHLIPVNEKELTEEDLRIFKIYESKEWTYGEWQTYTDSVSEYIKKNPKDKTNNSRDNFRDFLADQANLQFGREDAEERRAKEQS